MKDHHTIDSFSKAVDAIPLMGSTTRIDKALKMALTELFLEKNGGRDIAPNLLVLLTDGSQTPGIILSNVLPPYCNAVKIFIQYQIAYCPIWEFSRKTFDTLISNGCSPLQKHF